MFGVKIHRYIYLFGLVLLAVSLPLSKFTLSVSQFVLLGNWLFEGNFKEKFKSIKQNKLLLIFEGLFFIHVLGLAYTSNFEYAFLSLKLKLPLLVIPIILATTKQLNQQEFKLIIRFFIAAVVASSIIGTLGYYKILDLNVQSTRDIAIFIHHISLALMVNMALFFALKDINNEKRIYQISQLLASLWLVFFLVILKSTTGIVIFLITLYFILFRLLIQATERKSLYILLSFFVPVIVLLFSYLNFNSYFNNEPLKRKNLPYKTANGNLYYHNLKSHLQENGNYVYIKICESELKKEWNKRSKIAYDSLDKKGNPLLHTLIRFLASKNYTKDSVGVSKLSDIEIAMIQDGIPNYLYAKKFGVKPILADISWQISLYRENGSFQWNSVVQRYIAYKTGLNVFKENIFFGVGTGDVEDAFIEEYNNTVGQFEKHAFSIGVNQFLTFLVSFGIIGTIFLIFVVIFPAYIKNQFFDYYFLIFIIISFINMFSEEMLKFQTGTTIFAYFYSLLIFARNELIDGKKT